jgi:transposase-like protein
MLLNDEALARALGIEGGWAPSEGVLRVHTRAHARVSKPARRTPVGLLLEPGARESTPQSGAGRPGRPTKYRPEHCRQATLLCKLGATDEELARAFGVNEATLYRWQKAHPELREAIRAGKIVADIKIAGKLNQRATGFEYQETQAIKLKRVEYGPDGRKVSQRERVEIVKLRRVMPPDTEAIMFWLTNRQPEKWEWRVTDGHTGEGSE